MEKKKYNKIAPFGTFTGVNSGLLTKHEPNFITEIKGDLFVGTEGDSLAHCVSRDLKMGSGIASIFRDKFISIEELKNQNKEIGEVATLNNQKRFIYYLITKEHFWGKPTYETLRLSLIQMKNHCLENNVTRLSMPRIGCGLDKLLWNKVREIIRQVFRETNIQITIYYI